MLKDLFGLRAKELKANMLALAENEANSKAIIAKNHKAKKKALDELHD